jgi:hypothetical protein
VNCCQCSALGEDEVLMLRLVSALQSGDPIAALEVLADWLPEDATGPALQAARCFVRAITDAGLLLPRGDGPGAFPTGPTLH